MTSKLRPAVEVWDDAIAAWAADTIDTRQAAAAVIQAYGDEREANGRAEQAAELAKFKALAETLAGHLDTAVTAMREEGMCGDNCIPCNEATEALREYRAVSDKRTHTSDCDWHTDQYPWECTCGAEQKKNTFLQPLPKGIPVGPPQETTT